MILDEKWLGWAILAVGAAIVALSRSKRITTAGHVTAVVGLMHILTR